MRAGELKNAVYYNQEQDKVFEIYHVDRQARSVMFNCSWDNGSDLFIVNIDVVFPYLIYIGEL